MYERRNKLRFQEDDRMCCIMGYCGETADMEIFQKGFERTHSRGPDDMRIINTGNGLLGFQRLAIMGLHPEGMQPFCLDGNYVVCNGEIYGFEKMREALSDKYTFQSDSDCEVCFLFIENTGQRCSPCWTRNSH